jgi:predicted P-loop ATPase
MAARSNAFHPVKDYLLNLKWDGRPRVDSMLIRYLKCPNTEYHRQISRLMLVASVTRVFEPGHKFDFAVIIQGPQGVRKSTLIQTLYGEKWFGELHVDLGEQQRVAEAVMGKWGVELPELGSLHKSDHNKAKAFMRQQRDDVRLAYEKNSADLPRQFICWGTTNDKKYLRDPTGNRSFWPCIMGAMTAINTDGLQAERDQLWAEAFEIYWKLRDEQPRGSLPLYLQGEEATSEARELQEGARGNEMFEDWANAIRDWLETPITYGAFKLEMGAQLDPTIDPASEEEMQLVLRTVFTREQALRLGLGRPSGIANDHSSTQSIAKALDMLDGWAAPKATNDKGAAKRSIFGHQRRWYENTAASKEDRFRGYSIVKKEDDDVI